MSSKLLRGTFILTLGTMLSKVLGILYVIPFTAIVGSEGTTLFSYAYVPYTIFLSIATAGVPLAVSKYVAKYNAMGEYGVSRRLFESGKIVMLITGILSFLLLYSITPLITPFVISEGENTFSEEDVALVIRSVSFALLIVPVMSLIRGFFQGHESMGPTSVSQVIEQIARILFILMSTFIVVVILDKSVTVAISFATFGAFIGALGGLGALIWYWYKRRDHLNQTLTNSKGQAQVSLTDMYKELLLYAAPFVFVGIANPLFQAIDMFTFNRAMGAIGKADVAESAFGILTFQTHKLVLIPVSLAVSFGLALIPTITKAFVEQKGQLLTRHLNQTFQIVFFVTFPAVIGISLLADPAYIMFFGLEDVEIGGKILRWYAPVAILFALFSVTAAILQGINQQKFTVISLGIGLFVKLCLNYILIIQLGEIGAVIGTGLGYAVSVLFNFWVIRKYANYSYHLVIRRTMLMTVFTVIMVIVVATTLFIMSSLGISSESSRVLSIGIVIICAITGGASYLYLSYRTKLLYLLLGNRIPFLRKRQAVGKE
ncbi:polysaccharide biosynthesis protein [Cytobacillus sp. IB215665]|uniref:putative polysaccharide biosynthesis protein n=1 Tax=Cytobacillus sp. IB215665 TaxID=3097357 RepID=UPI002A0C70D0|nr:polysaccharide biosynthesis protein [Cytobacillus sp. IB215665]MDX8367465.1 polysaccharide biosynthesis protein [Cytobacillus sp. IB215665]